MTLQLIKPTLGQLELMTTDKGILQHESDENIEVNKPGVWPYSIDDNTRGLIAELKLPQELQSEKLINTYFNFIIKSFQSREDGFPNNYMNQQGDFINDSAKDLKDCFGRGLWALTESLNSDSITTQEKKIAKNNKKIIFIGKLNLVVKIFDFK